MINIIGSGFSGLVTAYYLTEQGLRCRVFEKEPRAGGLISTKTLNNGLVETAANALINSPLVEEMFHTLNLQMLKTHRESRARYIFRGKPKRWPLSIRGSIRFMSGLPSVFRKKESVKPRQFETVEQWGERVFGREALDYLVSPALQGIYAGHVEKLSATLVFSRFFEPRAKDGVGEQARRLNLRARRLQIRGSVAPPNGMGQLIEALEKYLRAQGVEFRFGETQSASDLNSPTIFSGSARAASEWLKLAAPEASEKLSRVELTPITTITAFFEPKPTDIRGFGVLFPRDQGVEALGVLFNNHIFENRSLKRSETWIYRGVDASISTVLEDRKPLSGTVEQPLEFNIQRWPEAIPYYTVGLEKTLQQGLELPSNIYLMGNYLGDLGLSRILERSRRLAKNLGSETMVKSGVAP